MGTVILDSIPLTREIPLSHRQKWYFTRDDLSRDTTDVTSFKQRIRVTDDTSWTERVTPDDLGNASSTPGQLVGGLFAELTFQRIAVSTSDQIFASSSHLSNPCGVQLLFTGSSQVESRMRCCIHNWLPEEDVNSRLFPDNLVTDVNSCGVILYNEKWTRKISPPLLIFQVRVDKLLVADHIFTKNYLSVISAFYQTFSSLQIITDIENPLLATICFRRMFKCPYKNMHIPPPTPPSKFLNFTLENTPQELFPRPSHS
ncbi:uncharacterized protein LOC135166630 [Diachasmimorpha longicaudata]|uniref:uncharacterized protein LOC135166630 n=1 Tax=Diachasmimorpha longicaudata TaxID=58733 RepID=UPI0030B9052D